MAGEATVTRTSHVRPAYPQSAGAGGRSWAWTWLYVDNPIRRGKGLSVTQDPNDSAAGAATWRVVIALLVEAAEGGYRRAAVDHVWHSTAVGADGLASAAIALLPAADDHLLDDVVLDQCTASLDPAGLLRRAEHLTRRHPIEQLPAGASQVIVDLLDLTRDGAA